jgi:hypothetical protein
MASYISKKMTSPTQLGTSASTVYTVGAGVTATVKEILVANVSGSSSSVSIHFVNSGGIASSSNLLFPAVGISANSSIAFDVNQVLDAGSTIQAFAGNASAINIMISGFEAS